LGAEAWAARLIAGTWSQPSRPFADAPVAASRDLVIGAVFAAVGVVLAGKRPRNLVGWLLLGVALSLSLNVAFVRYAVYGLLARPGAVPGAAVAASLGASTWVVLVSALALLLLTFPHGRLPSPRWRRLVWALVVSDVAVWIGGTTAPGPLPKPLGAHDNPFGVASMRTIDHWLPTLGWAIFFVFAAAAVSLVQRFRRARGDERQQYKWFAYASVVFPVILVTLQIGDGLFGQASRFDTIGSFVTGLTAAIIPIGTAVAVLRYRLYDIDHVISRTLVYGALSALLAACYAGLVLGLQAAFGSVTQGNELAVACSTLAVAAMFRPLRRRVQTAVDRRFYRSKVNAEETLARFGARLRHEADLDTLLGELQSVVGQTLAPAHVSLWLRPQEPAS
jgi:hypothetical protein